MQQLYRHFNSKDELMYIGISISAAHRLSQHKTTSAWIDDITKITIENFETREQVIEAETSSIKKEKPLYNVVHNKTVPEELKKSISAHNQAIIAKQNLVLRAVNFDLMYSLTRVAEQTQIPKRILETLAETNKISTIVTNRIWSDRWEKEIITRKMSGWAVIDLIDNLSQGTINIENM